MDTQRRNEKRWGMWLMNESRGHELLSLTL